MVGLLSALDGELSPIREAAMRNLASSATTDPKTGAALISHRPKVAPEAYALVIYPGITETEVARYEKLHEESAGRTLLIPAMYRAVLARLNGASLFQAALFGIPRSMLQDPPLLDRSTLHPLDIGTANTMWRLKYKVDPALLYFGEGPHSKTENLGYFIADNGAVETYRPGARRLESWPSLRTFLSAEVARLEAAWPEYEREQERLREQYPLESAAMEKPERRRAAKPKKQT
jgi:hypothetical protein